MKSGMNSTGKMDLVRVTGEFELSKFEILGFYSTNKGKKKPVKLILQTSLIYRKSIAEGSVTFQNIVSSLADFCDVVLVMPCSPTNKGKK